MSATAGNTFSKCRSKPVASFGLPAAPLGPRGQLFVAHATSLMPQMMLLHLQ